MTVRRQGGGASLTSVTATRVWGLEPDPRTRAEPSDQLGDPHSAARKDGGTADHKSPRMDETKALLRHLVATLAFRTAICVRDAPERFAEFSAGQGVRTPIEIVRHMTGLLYFSRSLLTGADRPDIPHAGTWSEAVAALERGMADLDVGITNTTAWHSDPRKALQGPLADALTHTGQLATLRRLAGTPINAGGYPDADIRAGHLHLR